VPVIATAKIKLISVGVVGVALPQQSLFVSGELEYKRPSNLFGDRVLDCEYLGKSFVEFLGPHNGSVVHIDQLHRYSNPIAGSLYRSVQNGVCADLNPNLNGVRVHTRVTSYGARRSDADATNFGEPGDKRICKPEIEVVFHCAASELLEG